MRKDMQRVIINRARVLDHDCMGKGGRLTHGEDDGVFHIGHRKAVKLTLRWKAFNDNIGPLYRFLRRRNGQAWNDVWAEVCAVTDPRSLTGWHLRGHVRGAVFIETHRAEKYLKVDCAFDVYVVDPDTDMLIYKPDRGWAGHKALQRKERVEARALGQARKKAKKKHRFGNAGRLSRR